MPARALQVEMSQRGDRVIALRVRSEPDDSDRALARRFAQDKVADPAAEDGLLTVPLDSTALIAHYLRAARLSGGVYVHLPALCPRTDCKGIRFTIKARHILFGDVEASGTLSIDDAAAADASVFFTNEEHPRLKDAVYVGPEFTQAAVDSIQDSLHRIRSAYEAIAGRDLLAGIGVIATIARNDAGYTGFGGDSLNIIRLTFDNPGQMPESRMVQAITRTYAHEVAHKLQSPRLFDLPQGRLVTEGSADFMKIMMLMRTHLEAEAGGSELVAKAYDQCSRQRGGQGLRERISTHAADFREFYDCGLIDYLALMFSSGRSDAQFIPDLVAALGFPPETTGAIPVDCMLLSAACKDPVLLDMMGDSAHLEARRAWFDEQWNAYVRSRQEGGAHGGQIGQSSGR